MCLSIFRRRKNEGGGGWVLTPNKLFLSVIFERSSMERFMLSVWTFYFSTNFLAQFLSWFSRLNARPDLLQPRLIRIRDFFIVFHQSKVRVKLKYFKITFFDHLSINSEGNRSSTGGMASSCWVLIYLWGSFIVSSSWSWYLLIL